MYFDRKNRLVSTTIEATGCEIACIIIRFSNESEISEMSLFNISDNRDLPLLKFRNLYSR